MRSITEIGLTSRFFQAKLAYQLVYHNNSGTLPLRTMSEREVMKNHEWEGSIKEPWVRGKWSRTMSERQVMKNHEWEISEEELWVRGKWWRTISDWEVMKNYEWEESIEKEREGSYEKTRVRGKGWWTSGEKIGRGRRKSKWCTKPKMESNGRRCSKVHSLG